MKKILKAIGAILLAPACMTAVYYAVDGIIFLLHFMFWTLPMAKHWSPEFQGVIHVFGFCLGITLLFVILSFTRPDMD